MRNKVMMTEVVLAGCYANTHETPGLLNSKYLVNFMALINPCDSELSKTIVPNTPVSIDECAGSNRKYFSKYKLNGSAFVRCSFGTDSKPHKLSN